MNSWLFPPNTRKVQFDELWSFVGKKQKNCDPNKEEDLFCGDQWDHVAFDPDSRLVLEVVVGKRIDTNVEMVVESVKERLGGEAPELVTTDGYQVYEEALLGSFGEEVLPPRTGKPGRPAGPRTEPPAGMCYGRVQKQKEKGRVVGVRTEVVFGELPAGEGVSTSYVERHNATNRHRNARKGRKTYRFSKDWEVHEAMTTFTLYSYNFCWTVRTLRQKDEQGNWQQRTPAMVAGLTDHVWSLEEWLTFPGVQRK
jgi:IS1 family transposase